MLRVALRSRSRKELERCTSVPFFRKQEGEVTNCEAMERLKEDCPTEVDVAQIQCGEFGGYLADYVDWHSDAYWRKWILYCRNVLLFATYTCKRGDEDLEVNEAASLLESLRCKA